MNRDDVLGFGEIPNPEPYRVTRPDVEAAESGADALIRTGDTQTAVTLYTLALKLRAGWGLMPQRRHDDP